MEVEELLELLENANPDSLPPIIDALALHGIAIEVVDEEEARGSSSSSEEEELLLRAEEEASLIQRAPTYMPDPTLTPAQALAEQGVGVFKALLPADLAAALRQDILDLRDAAEAALQPAQAQPLLQEEDELRQKLREVEEEEYMSVVLAPRAADGRRRRWDLKLPWSSRLAHALNHLLNLPSLTSLPPLLVDSSMREKASEQGREGEGESVREREREEEGDPRTHTQTHEHNTHIHTHTLAGALAQTLLQVVGKREGGGRAGRGGEAGGVKEKEAKEVEELIKELGEEIRLEELAAVISAPGAPRQVLHADTPWTAEALLYTVFCICVLIYVHICVLRCCTQTQHGPQNQFYTPPSSRCKM
jgi:hypothetical protein